MGVPGILERCEEVALIVPLNVQVSPALLAERTVEKEVEGNFLSLKLAENTVVVVALDFELFPL